MTRALSLRTETEMISKELVGAAGVHYVASELSFRGMIALPTIRNTAGYDLIVVSADGKRHDTGRIVFRGFLSQ